MAVQDKHSHTLECPHVEHVDVTIPMPSTTASEGGSTRSDYLVTFDGGAASALGTGGFLVWGPSGELRAARAIWYGKRAVTNNVAEAFALLEALQWLEDWGVERCARILVLGDS